MASREQQWKALYDALEQLLAEFGTNEPVGSGDYWLVDDDWGGLTQKIEVARTDFWSDAVHERVRRALARFSGWGVIVVFSDEASGRRGFVIYADRTEEA